VVPAVAYPVLPDYEGVSVGVPGVYVKGLDAEGNLIIDDEAHFVNPNGVTYTAATAPVILNTGAAGYGSQRNGTASSNQAKYGYINVFIGNRGKQSQVTDANGTLLYYTGDAPSCLVDQKAAARWMKYNILLTHLPGSIDRFVSTGSSGGAAHATMFAATSNNPDTTDSRQYVDADGRADFDALVAAHKADIVEIARGDKYGNNIVDLYNPLRYIGATGTDNPRWSRIMMGGVEGDVALLCSMNISIRWQMAGVKDVILQWQWNGGHVPSDIFSMSFSGYVDEMLNR
jgi:hypothetical protein